MFIVRRKLKHNQTKQKLIIKYNILKYFVLRKNIKISINIKFFIVTQLSEINELCLTHNKHKCSANKKSHK